MGDIQAAHRPLPQALLREATDRALLDEVVRRGRVTRAELADAAGYSRPTVSESVRRLVAAGLLDATGPAETGRRGRVGTFYSLGTRAGWVLAVELDQSGALVWSADLAGRRLREHRRPPTAPGDVPALVASVRDVVREALDAAGSATGPLRATGVSVANPVHPGTHEVVALPGSPFPEGRLSPAAIFGDLVGAPVLVDNDVNLAALAEHRAGAAAGATSFAYVFVGAGLGVGLAIGGVLVRGAHGLAGEIGYLPGSGPPAPDAGSPATLAAELASAGLGRSDAPSNDIAATLRLLDASSTGRPAGPTDGPTDGSPDGPADGPAALRHLIAAVSRAIASVAAVVDPELILLGGPVGTHPALLPPVRAALSAMFPGPTRIAHGTLGTLAPLHGALHLALDHARAAAVAVTPTR